jgi:hypothetical protein
MKVFLFANAAAFATFASDFGLTPISGLVAQLVRAPDS